MARGKKLSLEGNRKKKGKLGENRTKVFLDKKKTIIVGPLVSKEETFPLLLLSFTYVF